MLYFIVIKQTEIGPLENVTFKHNILERFDDLKCIITFEKALVNPHYHIIVETVLPMETIRQRIKRHVVSQKNCISIKNCEDKGKAGIYITKELNILKNTLFTDIELQVILTETVRINTERDRKRPWQDKVISRYVVLPWFTTCDRNLTDNDRKIIEIDINKFLNKELPCNKPFSKNLKENIFRGIVFTYYNVLYSQNNYIYLD